MKSILALVLGLAAMAAAERPNIVVILADDQGWGDLSHHGNTNLATPHLDSLAERGASFERFFVQPVCAPTRAEFLTGRFFSRTGVRGVSTGAERMNPDERTLAEVLRDGGYATGIFGKWHNGSQAPYHPNSQGFDEFYGFTSGHWGDYFDPLLERNGELVRGEGYIADDFTDKAIEWIGAEREQPFFCYIAHCTPHSPMQISDRWFDKFEGKEMEMKHWEPSPKGPVFEQAALAMVENLDWNVGRVLERLDELGIADDTIVVYFTDNGPNGYRWNGGMKGRKASVHEGGVRSPLFVRWPAKLGAGTVVEPIAGAVDLLPTLAAAAGVEVGAAKPLDGRDLMPLLLGQEVAWSERFLIQMFRKRLAVRSERLRWVRGDGLYDVVADPRQERDLSGENPELLRRMQDFAERYLEEVADGIGEDRRPFAVGGAEVTWLPARDANFSGGVKRSASAPNCSFLTGWSKPEDRILWRVEVLETGTYEVILHATNPESSVGATIDLRLGEAAASVRLEEAFDPPLPPRKFDRTDLTKIESLVKDFRPISMGTLELEAGVAGALVLSAREIPGETVADVRWLQLVRR